MLRPWPSVGPNSAKYSRSRGAVSVVATDSEQRADEESRCPAAISPSRIRTSRRRQRAELAEVPEHEHVNEHGERLDRELRHREIGRAEAEEHHGHAVADRSEREHGRHRRSGERRRERTGDDERRR